MQPASPLQGLTECHSKPRVPEHAAHAPSPWALLRRAFSALGLRLSLTRMPFRAFLSRSLLPRASALGCAVSHFQRSGSLSFDWGYATIDSTDLPSCFTVTHSRRRGDFSTICFAQSCAEREDAPRPSAAIPLALPFRNPLLVNVCISDSLLACVLREAHLPQTAHQQSS